MHALRLAYNGHALGSLKAFRGGNNSPDEKLGNRNSANHQVSLRGLGYSLRRQIPPRGSDGCYEDM